MFETRPFQFSFIHCLNFIEDEISGGELVFHYLYFFIILFDYQLNLNFIFIFKFFEYIPQLEGKGLHLIFFKHVFHGFYCIQGFLFKCIGFI